ncbi:MAG: transcriptional repressor [Bacteroidales bacterium]|nr:transcriptional repressor [Bacteroidales bacterium]
MKKELKGNYSFEDYLEVFYMILDKKKMNRTSERYNILREIYEIEGHFSADLLYSKLKNKKYQVSKTTIYNTLNLLESFNLIEKHHFTDSYAQYERRNTMDSHDHIINLTTGEIIEFQHEGLQKIIKEIEKQYNIEVSHHSFTLFCYNNSQS